jgi:5-formyltetrahydrofolate cyclo-ligase
VLWIEGRKGHDNGCFFNNKKKHYKTEMKMIIIYCALQPCVAAQNNRANAKRCSLVQDKRLKEFWRGRQPRSSKPMVFDGPHCKGSAMEPGLDSIHEQKQALRRIMRARRAEASARLPEAAVALRDTFLRNMELPPSSLVAVTVAHDGEIDPAPLAEALLAQGHGLCLPVVAGPKQIMIFRAWRPDQPLSPGAFGIPEPPASAPTVEPGVLFVPLLAFDRRGNRLGQGGGFYDRTLARLRQKEGVLAIGLGFAAQETSVVPAGPHDERLDVIATEKEIFRVAQ